MPIIKRRSMGTRIFGDSTEDLSNDDEAPDEIELEPMLGEKKNKKETLLFSLREQRAEIETRALSRSSLLNFQISVQNWTAWYVVLFVFFVILCESATSVSLGMRWFGSVTAWTMVIPNFTECREVVCRRRLPTIKYGFIYGFCLSLLVSSSNDVIRPSNAYARIFHWAKPCHKIERLMQALRYETKLPDNLSYDEQTRPFQALGLDNSYMRQFKDALEVHFDRYSRNETERFAYVTKINLIGNVFDDKGAGYLCEALEHSHAYTTQLLLGRNQNLGDKTASLLATLIQVSSTLTSLEFGGTSVTLDGLTQLYAAMGTRPFEYLGLEYTDKRMIQRLPWIFTPNPISQSLPQLHQAKFLQQVGLNGNMLNDNDMAELTENIKQTNITSLGLVHNKIGSRGVQFLLPLTKQLVDLQLGINWRIDDKGAILLANALKDPITTLETLGLFNCRVGQKGADAFLSIFPENKKLEYLSLKSPYIGQHVRQETLQALNVYVVSW